LIRRTGIYIFVLVAISGCPNPFATRTPEIPEVGGKRLPMLDPSSALNVLSNLKIAYQGLSPLDYLDTLSEDFVFVPDPRDAEVFPDVYTPEEPWDKARESLFAGNLLSDNVTESIWFRKWPPELMELDEEEKKETYEYQYDISLVHGRDAPSRIRGTGYIFLRERDDGTWAIYRWEDEKTDQVVGTWGELRARF